MQRRRIALTSLLVPLLVVVVACDSSPTGPEAPQNSVIAVSWLSSYSIVDAADDEGVAGFLWLPPVAGRSLNPDPVLDPSVLSLLDVEVCEWDGEACVGDPVASFGAGEGEEGLRIAEDDDGSDHFMAHWRVSGPEAGAGRSYRIHVLLDGSEIGHADVAVTGPRMDAPSADRGEVVVVRIHQTLPVKFVVSDEVETTDGSEEPVEGAGPGLALVTNQNSGNVSIVDLASGSVTGTIAVGSQPRGASFAPGGPAYVANYESDDVSVVDAGTAAVTATIPVGTNPISVSVSADGATAVVANAGSDDLSVLDLSTESVSATIPVCDMPQAVDLAPDGSAAYVACPLSSTVVVVDLGSGASTSTISVGSSPRALAVSPDGATVLTANYGSSDVSVVDVTTASVTATVAVGSRPSGVTFTPDGSEAWVTNRFSNDVSVIELASTSVSATVASGALPVAVGVASDHSSAVVVNGGEDTVSLVDAASRTVTATLPVGTSPSSVAMSR